MTKQTTIVVIGSLRVKPTNSSSEHYGYTNLYHIYRMYSRWQAWAEQTV